MQGPPALLGSWGPAGASAGTHPTVTPHDYTPQVHTSPICTHVTSHAPHTLLTDPQMHTLPLAGKLPDLGVGDMCFARVGVSVGVYASDLLTSHRQV